MNVSMTKKQWEIDNCCMLQSRGTSTISANIIVHCKRLQENVKSIIKDDKNVLKSETILEKIRQGSKWWYQRIINHMDCSAGPSHCELFSLITMTQSYLWGSQTVVKKGRAEFIQLKEMRNWLLHSWVHCCCVDELMIEIDPFYGGAFQVPAC